MFDLAIHDGLLMDGTGAGRRRCSLGIARGIVVEIRDEPIAPSEAREVIDARGKWVLPGFVDCHTHYDADILVGFSDAGAHLRNMAFYNMHLRMLRLARDAERDGVPFMSVERAVWRCTGELAEWFGLDAGVLAEGRRADVVVVDPEALDDRLDARHEAPIPELGGCVRMVRRNDATVIATVVGGKIAWKEGAPSPALGRRRFGRFLGFGEEARALDPEPASVVNFGACPTPASGSSPRPRSSERELRA
jgi:N-acyl-D-aspartate/D-glutamate deacylase